MPIALLILTAILPTFADAPKAALARARSERKPALLGFHAAWCLPCKELERVTLPHPEVRDLLKDHLVIKVDAERGEGQELAQAYDVFGYPTLVFLDASGVEVGRIVGFATPEELVKTARGFRGPPR